MCGHDGLLIQGGFYSKISTNQTVENNISNDWLTVRGAKCFREAICSVNITVHVTII